MLARVWRKSRLWGNVYRRIAFFRKMYPLRALAQDAVLFPYDYYLCKGRPITTVRNLTFAITHRCNIRCAMCYFQQELVDCKDLPLDIYGKVLKATRRSRPCVILSGGEPCTHPQLLDMVAMAKQMGLPVQIFTNGTLVKPALADQLRELGLDYINFTLLGDPEGHSRVARMPGTYERLYANLEYFAAHRGSTKLMLNYTVTPWALEGLDHALKLVRELKLDGLRIQHYNFLLPKEFAAQGKVMELLFGLEADTNEVQGTDDLSGVAERLLAFQERLDRELPGVAVQWAPTLSPEETWHWYSFQPFRTQRKCLYPWRGMLVDADGKLYPCSKIYLELGDLAGDDPLAIWNSDTMHRFRAHLQKGLFPACSRCCKL